MEQEPNPPETYDRTRWVEGDVVECWDCNEYTNEPVSWNGSERCLKCAADWAMYRLQDIGPLGHFEREFLVGVLEKFTDAVKRGVL